MTLNFCICLGPPRLTHESPQIWMRFLVSFYELLHYIPWWVNVKSHWKVQGHNFTHEKASNRLTLWYNRSSASSKADRSLIWQYDRPLQSKYKRSWSQKVCILYEGSILTRTLLIGSHTIQMASGYWYCSVSACITLIYNAALLLSKCLSHVGTSHSDMIFGIYGHLCVSTFQNSDTLNWTF